VKRLEAPLARAARLVVAPDVRRAEVMRGELRLAGEVVIVPNSPRLRDAAGPGKLREALARRSVTFDRIVLRQGRIGPGHAIEVTLRSMPHWSNPAWGFVVMGPADPHYVDRLQELACELGVSDRFVVLPSVAYDEVADYTREADVGHGLYEPINVNHVEMGTASNKVIEYMAAGIPSIVTDSPSFRDLVALTGCGLAIDVTRPEAIAAAVDRLLGSRELARAMAEAGRRAFERDLQYDRHAAGLRDRIEALAARL
jgi:glycosyltransferase involved in cell wall biosynthesis